MSRILLSSTCEEQRSVVRFLWTKKHNPSEIQRTFVECMGKTVWTVPMFPGGAHFSRRQSPEQCASPGDVVTVRTVFHIHVTHVPVNFTRVLPISPQKSY